MPETSIDEHSHSVWAEDDVDRAPDVRGHTALEPESVAAPVKLAPQCAFRCGVLGALALHAFAHAGRRGRRGRGDGANLLMSHPFGKNYSDVIPVREKEP